MFLLSIRKGVAPVGRIRIYSFWKTILQSQQVKVTPSSTDRARDLLTEPASYLSSDYVYAFLDISLKSTFSPRVEP